MQQKKWYSPLRRLIRGMHYLEGLKVIHETLKPANYFEIGCRFGDSLALADCQSIGVDPTIRVNKEVSQPHELFELTSDDFFANQDLTALFGGAVDFAFVDGMHHAEYVLRDFANIERHSTSGTVVAFDDMLPKKNEWAQREVLANAWCGDVYKFFRVLKKYRPDLEVNVYDVNTKGIGVVFNLDPKNTVLTDNLAQLEEDLMGDVYAVDDVASLRKEFEVKPVSQLAKDIARMRASRSA